MLDSEETLNDIGSLVVHHTVWYVSMAVLTLVLTISKQSRAAREWVMTSLAVGLMVELFMKHAEWDTMPFLTTSTVFEKVEYLKTFIAFFMHALVGIAYHSFEDIQRFQLQML